MNRIEFHTDGGAFWGNSEYGLHRLDGPAVEYINDNREWWVEDKLHRINGPAVEWFSEGYKAWYVDNELHRLDGPTVEFNGYNQWYIEGVEYSKLEFIEELGRRKKEKGKH